MSKVQIKFEAYVRDFMLNQVEHDLGMLGINAYSLTPVKYRSPTVNHSPNERPYFHKRDKLEVVVDESMANKVGFVLRQAVDRDPIAPVDELVRFYQIFPGVVVHETFCEQDAKH